MGLRDAPPVCPPLGRRPPPGRAASISRPAGTLTAGLASGFTLGAGQGGVEPDDGWFPAEILTVVGGSSSTDPTGYTFRELWANRLPPSTRT